MIPFAIPLLMFGPLSIQEKPRPAPSGEIDYEARLNDLLSKGITPETNANVLIWKALGPTPEGGPRMPPEFFKRLGIPEPPKEGEYFLGLGAYGREHLKLGPDEVYALGELEYGALRRPWTVKDYPHIAAWLTLNEKPLALVIEGMKRPRYYNPLVSRRNGDDTGSLDSAPMPSVPKCRELASALCVRAMLRVSVGKTDEAWQDLLAAHRLARLVASGGTLIESLVGIAIDHFVSSTELSFLNHTKLTAREIRDRLKGLQALPPIAPMAEQIDIGMRASHHDLLQQISRGRGGSLREGNVSLFSQEKKPTPDELKALAAIDWGLVHRDTDQWFDRMVAALRINDRATLKKEFGRIEDELEALAREAKKQRETFKKPGKGIIGRIEGKSISNTLLGLLAPAYRMLRNTYDRSEQINRNLQVAFALAAYHADVGRYPAKLADLAPKYLAKVPDDLFAGRPLIYRPTEKGYLFYSVGQNEKDDGGQSHDENLESDDLPVRMPLPELKPKK